MFRSFAEYQIPLNLLSYSSVMNASLKISDRLRVHAELCRKLAAEAGSEEQAAALRDLADRCCEEHPESTAASQAARKSGQT
jgi:hypothetical protein